VNTLKKLNLFQRGFLQKAAVAVTYLVVFVSGAYFLDWLDKWTFINRAKDAAQQGFLSEKGLQGFTRLIEWRDERAIVVIVAVGLACGFVGWLFMLWAAKRNWSWPVSLPRVVEFRLAMEQLGVVDPLERIAFVQKHKFPVFIAFVPLVGMEHTNVEVRLYPFAYNDYFSDKAVFEQRIGSQTLCMDAEDYERLLEEHGPKTRAAYSARIAELEQNLTDLKAVNSLQSADIAKLTERNETLTAENAEHRAKLQTAPAREGNADSREQKRIPFWRVTAPLVNRLIAEAGPETRYTRPQIQDAFLAELEKFPELKPAVQEALRTAKKEKENTPFSLEGWGMDAIRLALGDLTQKEPGAARKARKD
jgi:regulator of replication initiation timing